MMVECMIQITVYKHKTAKSRGAAIIYYPKDSFIDQLILANANTTRSKFSVRGCGRFLPGPFDLRLAPVHHEDLSRDDAP